MTTTTCSCGCATLPLVTEAGEACRCGCDCCTPVDRTREEEIAELEHLRDAAEERLTALRRG